MVSNHAGVNAINKAKHMLHLCRAGVLKLKRYKSAALLEAIKFATFCSSAMYKRKYLALSTASLIMDLNVVPRK